MKLPKRKKRPATLVLVSMIDMFTILIIYLLSQSATKVISNMSEIKSELPPEQEQAISEVVPSKPVLNLSLFITKSGFLVSAGKEISGGPAAQVTSESSFQIPMKGDSYDFEKLNQALNQVKTQYPTERQVIITADPEVTYEHLIAAMDATRETVVQVDGKPENKELFSRPTIAAGVL